MEGVGELVGQMMETEAEDEGPKRKALSMEDLRRRYPWWPSNGASKGASTLIEMESLPEGGEVTRSIKNTKL